MTVNEDIQDDTSVISAAARTFRETGYVVLENIYEPAWVASLRSVFEDLVEHFLAEQGGIEALEGKLFGNRHIGIHPALTLPWSDPLIVSHPIIDKLLAELLGTDYQCGYYHTNAAYPGSDFQAIHRDAPPLFPGYEMNVPHPVASIVLNVPLCDFSEENGSTEVWPGSHLLVDRSPEEARELEARAAPIPSQRTNVRAGSVIARDLRMFHRGMPNRSSYVRGMLSIVYVRSFRATGMLDIPMSTWDNWPERTRQIFRNNRVTADAETPVRYRITRTSQ